VSWDLIRGLVPQFVGFFVLLQLLPFMRVLLRPSTAAFVALALVLPGFGAEASESELGMRCLQSLLAAVAAAFPLLLLSEYLSVTARSFELLRGTMWAEQQQIVGDERGAPLETFALLILGNLCLGSPERFTPFVSLTDATSGSLSVESFSGVFEDSLRVLFPVLAVVLVFELSQGLLGRLARRATFDLLPVKLLLSLALLAWYLPERLLN
jgi:hypothetical protein